MVPFKYIFVIFVAALHFSGRISGNVKVEETHWTKGAHWTRIADVVTQGYEIRPLGDAWISDVILVCISNCLALYTNCHSVRFNELTGECTPGSWLDTNQAIPTPDAYTSIYATPSAFCDSAIGFVFDYSIDACLHVGDLETDYDTAKQNCESLNSVIFMTDTTEKYDFLHKIPSESGFVHVGLTDLYYNETYYWSNGKRFLPEQSQIWAEGEPNVPTERCVFLFKGSGLVDYQCNSINGTYVCEKLLE